MSGLDPEVPDLARSLRQRDEDTLRRVSSASGELALRVFPVDDPRIAAARGYVDAGNTGDSLVRDDLQRLIDELDEIQLDLQQQLDEQELAGNAADFRATDAEQAMAYGRARAANALWFALDADPAVAAHEGLYEAAAALEDVEYNVARRLVEAVVRGESDPVGQAVSLYRERASRDDPDT